MTSNFTEPIDKENADAVMHVSINANREVYNKIREENPFMCQALRELMEDEIQEEIKAAEEKAAQEATIKAVDATTIANIKSLMQTLSMDAKAAMETLRISTADQIRYMAML